MVRTGGAAGEIGSRATSGRSGRGWSCRFASPRPLAASSASSSSLFACQPRRPARPVDQRATWRTSQGKVRPGIAACVVSIRTAPGVDCCSNAPMRAADRTELGVCMASRAVGAVETVGERGGRCGSAVKRRAIRDSGLGCPLPPAALHAGEAAHAHAADWQPALTAHRQQSRLRPPPRSGPGALLNPEHCSPQSSIFSVSMDRPPGQPQCMPRATDAAGVVDLV